jgi:DNA-binding CsgD family transcriptional regulator
MESNNIEPGDLLLPEEGVILTNLSLKPVAFDAGATAIVTDHNHRLGNRNGALCLPEQMISVLNHIKPRNGSSARATVRLGEQQYVCRVRIMTPQTCNGMQPMLLLHLHRDRAAVDAVYQIAGEYDLTDRETQALLGLARGLTSKEVAEEMHISPHTVKAYVRLIMIKLGVTRRAGIVGKLLEHNGRIDGC